MSEPEPAGARRPPSGWRLADRSSQYLRDAAEQAIDWHPWGEEPFALAKRLNRPILLDVGAAWCHWCHVMDEGTYTDAEVARLLARHFVAVKVDRDESPEVDRRYQRQVGALTGEGGWPLTAFLTPEGEVFLGGTYFPPQDGHGRPGFRRVLVEVARVWKDDPSAARKNVAAVREALERMAGAARADVEELDRFVEATVGGLDAGYDPVYAGFGQQPKFPHPVALSLYFWQAWARHDARAGARGIETLRRMAEGGLYDQLGGGFHRYSVDEGWHVPHFEKMAADNAQLLGAYVEGAARSGDLFLEGIVRGLVAWTEGTLGDARGGFAASQDADNAPGDDGGYFTWSRAEMKEALDGDEFRVLSRLYGLDTEGRMPHDPERNVLFRALPIEEVAAALSLPLARARALQDAGAAKLLAVRAQRPAPVVDRALYAPLNGAYVRSLAAAGRYLGEPRALALARAAADRFLATAYEPRRGVAHRLEDGVGRGFGLLEDQVEFGLGLAELAAATAEPRYAGLARELADLADAEFRDGSGLLRDLAPKLYDGPSVGSVQEPSYPLEDSPHLSANAAWALLQLRLSNLLGDEARREAAGRHLRRVAGRVRSSGLFAAGTALAAGILATPPARVVVEGSGPGAEALARAAERAYHPNLVVFRGTPPAPFSMPEELASAAAREGPARALLCFGTRCRPPITEPAALASALASGGSGSAP